MPGRPFQSSLIPYKSEIANLRREQPPVSYRRIAVILRERHGLIIQHAAIAKFVKTRSGGRKVYFFRKDIEAGKTLSKRQKTGDTQMSQKEQLVKLEPSKETSKPVFEFTYSERYNLTRLPPEEAAEIRKKLDEEERQRLDRYKSSKRIEPTWK
jgi:hypothetical protein